MMPQWGRHQCASAFAAGKIQQLQAAYVLEKSCEHKGCEFVINTCVAACCPDVNEPQVCMRSEGRSGALPGARVWL